MSLPDLSSPDMNPDCSISNLSLKVRCNTRNLCCCTVFLKAVYSFLSGLFSFLSESRGGLDESGGKSIPLASICKCVDVLLVRLIMQT